MTLLIIILFFVCWLILGVFLAYKQDQADSTTPDPILVIGCIVLAPLWLFGAIIRQVFIEDWQ